ncbi:ferredoxin [Actinoplanes sp. URMC 104]|uniref:ferredoxin n=1 Tax=Actinoplanes sp. URMC 104 TaxID=3423409 RepID=UPI003F19E557
MSRLHIDWTACDGRGVCAGLLPELLAEDDWGFPAPRGDLTVPRGDLTVPRGDLTVPRGDLAVPPALEPAARQAVDRCPALALRLVSADPAPASS